MARIRSRRGMRGVSLIEVLMAVLIFSLGLIGLAGLLIVSTRSNQTAFVRTQVTFLASSMADRMRANPYGLWKDYYSDTFPYTTGTVPKCDVSAACGPEDIAKRDKLLWTSQLKAFLPGLGPSTIACTKATDMSYDPTAVIAMRPPFGGTCTMIITWAERGYGSTDDNTADGSLQSFTWVFQP
ncbi:type IV pilus modification protein PilV [Luteibacter sp. UNC138MFCol5.1]|uniref:type IV pilus modification protein PilV n=1 Tax=Luteibacter sp. UNC138MFCol5.1 TaxID=1502774 RepID=UPI001C434A91|nr:type IV pilus modification protein PilV [Luteibacter sp. UNC138MFCol5.1]